jgi:hypothetical protein
MIIRKDKGFRQAQQGRPGGKKTPELARFCPV